MIDQLIVPLMLTTAFVGGVMIAANVIGATLYDVRLAKRQREYRHHPHARRYRQRPLITLIISAHNDASAIEHCLNSIFASPYKKLEVIVVDHGSADATRQVVQAYMRERPRKNIRFVARRSAVDQRGALAAVYRRHGTGEIVMTLKAANTLDKFTLSAAAQHFNMGPGISVLNPALVPVSSWNVAGLFQKYQNLLGQRARKFGAASNSEYAMNESTLYRYDTFLALYRAKGSKLLPESAAAGLRLGNRQARAYYASDVIVYTPALASVYALLKQHYLMQCSRLRILIAGRRLFFAASPDHTRFLTCVRLPFAACASLVAATGPIVLGYFTYLAFKLHEPTLLLVAGSLLSVLLLFAIWDDDQLRIRQKLTYSLGIPITYSLFYVLAFVPTFVLLRTAMVGKKV